MDPKESDEQVECGFQAKKKWTLGFLILVRSRPMAVYREFVYIVWGWDLVAQGCEALAKSS